MVELGEIILKGSSHETRADGVCIMEAAAWLAGEPHSDAPECVSVPELRKLALRLNDSRWPSDEARTTALRPYLPRLMTATATEEQRSVLRFKMADIACREIAPEALDRGGRKAEAETLRALAPIVDRETALKAKDAAYAAYAADAAAAVAYAAAYAVADAVADDAAAAATATYAAAYAADAAAAAAYAAAYTVADDAAAAAAAAAAYAAAARGEVLAKWTVRLMDAALACCTVAAEVEARRVP